MKLIDADELFKVVMCEQDKYLHQAIDVLCKRDRHNLMSALSRIIRTAPTVDAELVKHGHWLDNGTLGDWTCSVCGADTYIDEDYSPKDSRTMVMRYCHYCGARMDAKQKEDTA